MILPTAYFLVALLLFQTARGVENTLIPCSEEWFLDYEVPNATDCIKPANYADLTKCESDVYKLTEIIKTDV